MAQRGGCATALMGAAGLFLALPGVCVFFSLGSVMERYVRGYETAILWAAVMGLICVVAYLIYDFSRER